LIIADEPTSALDVSIQAQILELLKELVAKSRIALMIITHNMGVVARYVDRVAIMYAGKIAEQGPVLDIFGKSGHPFTLGLLHSVPRIDQLRHSKLEPIEGQPPDLTILPPGCAYRGRCTYAVARCEKETPPLMQINGDHWSACWEYAKLIDARKGQ